MPEDSEAPETLDLDRLTFAELRSASALAGWSLQIPGPHDTSIVNAEGMAVATAYPDDRNPKKIKLSLLPAGCRNCPEILESYGSISEALAHAKSILERHRYRFIA